MVTDSSLARALAPYSALTVVVGSALYYGPVAYFVGLLAHATASWDIALGYSTKRSPPAGAPAHTRGWHAPRWPVPVRGSRAADPGIAAARNSS